MSIVPPNFVELVVNVIPAPNYLFRIAANTCSVKPYLFVQTMLPATLFLFTRIILFDLDDVIVDNSRRAAFSVAGGKRKKSRPARRAMGARQKPNRAVGATRFLFFPINLVERIGFTWLLANFADDLSISWMTIMSQCPACFDTGESIALGPMLRDWTPGQQFLNVGFEGIPMENLVQNRAGWPSTLQSVGLPQGTWNVVVSGTVSRAFGPTITLTARLKVRRVILGFPITTIHDEQSVVIPTSGTVDFIISSTVTAEPTTSTTVFWEWQTNALGLYALNRIEGEAIITGQSTCAS